MKIKKLILFYFVVHFHGHKISELVQELNKFRSQSFHLYYLTILLNELLAKLQEAGFEVEDAGFQNQVSRLAWWLNSRLFKRRALPLAQSRLFDRLVPFIRAIEGERPTTGLSLVAIGRKGGAAPGAGNSVQTPAAAETGA